MARLTNAYIVCPRDCRFVRFILRAPRWLAGGFSIEAVRVEQDTQSWVKVFLTRP